MAERCCCSPGAAAPRGFNPVQDLNDNYQFLYPFGWQEVTVGGVDVVYKDVVEPLESVSVTITPTDKKDVTEFGDIADVSGHERLRQVLGEFACSNISSCSYGPVCGGQQQQQLGCGPGLWAVDGQWLEGSRCLLRMSVTDASVCVCVSCAGCQHTCQGGAHSTRQ